LVAFDILGLVYEDGKLACGLEAKDRGKIREIRALRTVGFGRKEIGEFMEIVKEQIKMAGVKVKKEKKLKEMKVIIKLIVGLRELERFGIKLGKDPKELTKIEVVEYITGEIKRWV